jgi:transmembrane sensor
VLPGKYGAILTLADGKKLVIDSLNNGLIAQQNGSQVKLKNGELTYEATGSGSESVTYNTMTTPRGRQFQLQLPDGTRVWLNAASTISFPTVFNGDKRIVNITGEAYFEVVKNKRPFVVNAGNKAAIEVLGTHFNVRVYNDEAVMKTTLIEGAVRVSANRQNKTMRAGQQVQVQTNDQIILIDAADTDQAIAWKKGFFNFKGYDIKSMMRDISRWYDLDVVYESEPAPRSIVGEMERSFTLSETMATLKDLGIKYRLEGKKLIISNFR